MQIINKKIFKNFGPSFLILALGIGSGEFILWPFLTANYGLGILWGALLGISLQFFLISMISRYTLIFKENIIEIFSKVFSYSFLWILFSTIVGFGWPGFSSLASELLVNGFSIQEKFFLPLAILILIFSALILISSKSAYKKILFFEKIIMTFLLFLTSYIFIFYFQWEEFKNLIKGFFGFGENYFLIPENIDLIAFGTIFLGAVAYAGSGGNLILSNSFYLMKEKKNWEKIKFELKNIFQKNIIFFWGGGVLIISMLSYISHIVLKNQNSNSDFLFLIEESKIFSQDIHFLIGPIFLILGIFAIVGVQIGILDFIGRIAITGKKYFWEKIKNFSDRKIYSMAILITTFFGLLIFFLGFEKPEFLIVLGAVINAFSMGVIALLLFFVEIKKVPLNYKKNINKILLILTALLYFGFFIFVVYQNLFL